MLMRRVLVNLTVGTLVFGPAACSASDDSESADSPAQQPAVVASATAADTTGAAIWAHLQDSRYQDWDLWPGKGEKYAGQEPHGMLLTTYLNDAASRALSGGASTMPPGSIVVKENYMPDGTLAAVTTMFKVEAYNPEANDWFFSKHLPNGELDRMPNGMEMEGRLAGCTTCHQAVAANDYIFTSQLGGG